jgi:small subunit ribosomal protein S16
MAPERAPTETPARSELARPRFFNIDLFSQSGMLAPLMLMMRLQRVGRKNDPSYRIVVTDKRTGPKSDRHIDRLGSYNPKMNHVQIDGEKAKEWLAKGVQPSDTLHNILVSQKIIDAKKKNVLPKKSPIIDEAKIKAEAEAAAAKVEAEAKAKADAEAAAAAALEVEVVADQDDPTDHAEVAEVSEEVVEDEADEHAAAQADAEKD